jgi:hypothetical protein
MWLLILTIAMAPDFVPVSKQAKYLEEKDCRKALAVAMELVAKDGVIIIGRCEKAKP